MEQELNYKEYVIKVIQDTDPQNPRTEWDNLGIMNCWHSRYSLGDKHDFETPEGAWKQIKKNHVVLPLYLSGKNTPVNG